MDTVTAILWTQLPLVIAILIGAYELYRTKKELIAILNKLSERKK